MKHNGKKVNDFYFEANALDVIGRIRIRATLTKDQIKVRIFRGDVEDINSRKIFKSVEEFYKWYHSLSLVAILKKYEILV